MDNIETLLAAVAHAQGFGDGEGDVSARPEVRVESSPGVLPDSGVSPVIGGSAEMSGASQPSTVENQLSTADVPVVLSAGPVIGTGDKRKRGRPPKGHFSEKPPAPKRKKQEDEEEDVCFICFDGGSLLLCDRKGCPKAYHQACIKRDDAFFQSKSKWNCGWHICSVCQKASHYMCYTCTYSLCKGCAKDTDYLCVRGNKGFCTICMKTILLIENKGFSDDNSVQVDFDDSTSWEYLFKVYWVCLKEKLSITLNELLQAKKPLDRASAEVYKPQLNHMHHASHDEKASASCRRSVHLELNKFQEETLLQNDPSSIDTSGTGNNFVNLNNEKCENNLYTGMRSMNKDTNKPDIVGYCEKPSIEVVSNGSGLRKVNDVPEMKNDVDEQIVVNDTDKPNIDKYKGGSTDEGTSKARVVECTEWASKDLLEFIGHMKHGDTSPLSQFDVQTLMLDYVKRNNLRDPCQKGQIVCDSRLKKLFGKPRIDHIEMLKLLEFHFLMEDSQSNYFIPAGFVGRTSTEVEVDEKNWGPTMENDRKKQKTSEMTEERALKTNLDEYAAIDVHNVNLIYLRRDLLENLVEDKDNFHDTVFGSMVRVRIPTNDQKQDVYRLVQVVGTIKVAEPYRVGDRLADVMLVVLNLNKKEVVSMDTISNSAITEDECRQLCQSIRCGVVKHFTVGEVQKKAIELQPLKLNDWLEAEILHLNLLRDQANEKGDEKKLREIVHKLELLQSPEERHRRISEIPVIHEDPKMCPTHESEDVRINENSGKGSEECSVQILGKMIQNIGATGSQSSVIHINQVDMTNSEIGGWNDQAMFRSGLEEPTATNSIGNLSSPSNIETEKLWHYRDPNGKIQGPFSILQLRKWSMTGLFPHDMRIWTNHEQYDSLLLFDALNRNLHGSSEVSCNSSSNEAATGTGGSMNGTHGNSEQTEAGLYDNSDVLSGNISTSVMTDDSQPPCPEGWDILKGNDSFTGSSQPQSLLPSSSLGQTNAALPDEDQDPQTNIQMSRDTVLKKQYDNHCQSGQSTDESLRCLPVDLIPTELESVSAPVPRSPVLIKQDGSFSTLLSPSPTTMIRNINWGIQTAEKHHSVSSDANILNSSALELLSPTSRSGNEDQGDHATETKQYDFINFIVPNSGPIWSTASGPVLGGLQLPGVADEWCGYSQTPSKSSAQEWHSGVTSPSSLKPPEITSNNAAHTSSSSHLIHDSPSNIPNWLAICNEPIEFDALGEESVSDLLAEVDAMESQGRLPSPTSAMKKFVKELIQDCKDDCFEFSNTPDPGRSDAFSSTGEIQLTCQQFGESLVDSFNSFRRSSVHSSASSEGETSASVYPRECGLEYNHAAPSNTSQDTSSATMVLGNGPETNDPGWGTVQGNINLVTVQGNVNLVLGGPAQNIANLGWGTNPGPAWGNPSLSLTPANGNTTRDSKHKHSGEWFNSTREWGYQGSEPGFGRGRHPWGRQLYGGSYSSSGSGGFSRPPTKGQRVCKFYESGRCKKGAFCDYLHP